MKNKKKIIAIGVFIIIAVAILITSTVLNRESETEVDNENVTEVKNETINIQTDKEDLSEEEKEEINEVKQSVGITGDTDLYEVQENNNTKIPVIKASVKYKVAFAGMIKGTKPDISEADNILKENHPENAGIWIYEKDRNRILKLINNITNCEYQTDENGYLKIAYNNNPNENDKKIEKIINGNKLYILNISSTCYIVDEVTGEVLDYNFENMDKYQAYEYFEDDSKLIVFMTENKNNQLDETQVMSSVLKLLEI